MGLPVVGGRLEKTAPLPGWVLRGKATSRISMAPSGAELGSPGLEPGTPELGCCVCGVGGSLRGSGGGQWVAAMQGQISSSSLEHQAQVGELRVPLGCAASHGTSPFSQARAPVFAHPPSCPPCCHGPRRRQWQVKAEPRGAACSALHGCSCMAAACMLLGWPVAGQQGSPGHGGVGGLSCLQWGTYVGNS